ncbi:MAG: histone deacetylase [Planctomycetota bacterium]
MTTSTDVLVLTDRRGLDHVPDDDHPEKPPRLRVILEALAAQNEDGWTIAAPQPVDRAVAARVHTEDHLDALEAARGQSVEFDWDTRTSPGSIDVAELAAGAAVDAVDAIMSGRTKRAFALMRPPGHHAETNRAMGFCLLNSIAIAAAHACAAHSCQRVLIVDWDVHHGNGTAHTFAPRTDVLVFNLHEWPLYPGTGPIEDVGVGDARGYTINMPMAAGRTDDDYEAVFAHVLEPVAAAYQPELILVSAGFDAHERDPLGSMSVTTAGFARLCARVRALADAQCHGRLALVLEGGYDIAATAASVIACLDVLRAPTTPAFSDSVSRTAVVDRIWAEIAPYWPQP